MENNDRLSIALQKNEEEPFKHAAVELGLNDAGLEEMNQYQHRISCGRKEALEARQLFGQFHRDIKHVKNTESSWEWTRSGDLN